MLFLSGRKRIKRAAALCLAFCLAILGIPDAEYLMAYGDTGEDGQAIVIQTDKVFETLLKTDGKGKSINLDKIPEGLQSQMEGLPIVQEGRMNGIKYYVTADLMGGLDEENPADSLMGLSVIVINRDEKDVMEIPQIRFTESGVCSFSLPDEPEQIWDEAFDGGEANQSKTSESPEDKEELRTATPNEAEKEDTRHVRTATSSEAESVTAENEKTEKPEKQEEDGDFDIRKDTIPVASPSSAASQAEKATPSEAQPEEKDTDAGAWALAPRTAKRVFLEAQTIGGTEVCNFLTDVKVTTVSGGDVSDVPIDIEKMILIEWEYQIPQDGGVSPNVSYTFEVPEVFRFDNLSFDLKSADTGHVIAKVELKDTDGTLTFNDTAMAEGELNPGIRGSFAAKGGINKDKTGNGGLIPVTFSLAPGQKDVEVYFPLNPLEAKVKLEKTSELDSKNNKIRWTIKAVPEVSNARTAEDEKLHTLTIHDTLAAKPGFALAGGSETDLMFEVTDSDLNPINGGTLTVDSDQSFTYRFPDDTVSGGKSYCISYDTVFSLESWNGSTSDILQFQNTANRDFSYYNYILDESSKKAVKSSAATPDNGTESTRVTASQPVTGGFITKTGKKSGDGKSIDWEITVNSNRFSITSAVITDTITAVSSEEPGSKIAFSDVSISRDGGAVFTPSIVPIEEGGKKSSFTLDLGNINDKVIVKYSTNIDEKFRLSNNNTSFNNKAVLKINGNIDIPGNGSPVSTGGLLLDKKSTYNSKDHTIEWTIDVNKGGHALTEAKVTDIIPAGLTLVGGKSGITSTGSSDSVEWDESKRQITVSYPGSFSDRDTISFKTTVDNPDIWATNNKSGTTFTNTAKITAVRGMSQSEYEKSADCHTTSTVLEKTGKAYDPVTKRVKWELTVNKNGMEMTDAVITDSIPEGQTFVDKGSVSASFTGAEGVVESYSYDAAPRILTIRLAGSILEQKAFQYETELTDLSVLESNDKNSVSNSAALSCGEMTGTVNSSSASANQAVSKSILTKAGTSNNSEGTITWSVGLNENRGYNRYSH